MALWLSALLSPGFVCIAATLLVMAMGQVNLVDWLLSGVVFILPPTDDDILALPPHPDSPNAAAAEGEWLKRTKKLNKRNKKKNKKMRHASVAGGRGDAELQLSQVGVTAQVLRKLPMLTQLDTLLFFTFICGLAFVFEEFWACMMESAHSDLLNILMPVVMIMAWVAIMKAVVSSGWFGYEMRLSLGCGLIIGALCFVHLHWHETHADSGLLEHSMGEAGARFSAQLNAFLAKRAPSPASEASGGDGAAAAAVGKVDVQAMEINVVVAILCGAIAVGQLMPAMRVGRVYNFMTNIMVRDGRRYEGQGALARALWVAEQAFVHINMLSSLFVAALWVPFVSRDALVAKSLGDDDALMTAETFESLRLWALWIAIIGRLFTFRTFLQAFADQGLYVVDQLSSRTLTITQLHGKAISQSLRRLWSTFPLVCLQYLAPLSTALMLALTYKRRTNSVLGVCDAIVADPFQKRRDDMMMQQGGAGQESAAAGPFSISGNELAVPVLSTVMLWTHLTWFLQTTVAVFYWRRVMNNVADETAQRRKTL
eukprot:TRINITY_DN59930_c0_g1_i1.p1 TRINITY_DN59930_c0_g1~~TRINITY_DN59930_c0_g1_i1.p1  ORF type:complete len:541 (+),score=251.53 TRINITY_DN59930_c0_g1_i1:41-1663(+)